jgi:Protein of unknown function
MTNNNIDKTILEIVETRWRKVAFVISRTEGHVSPHLPEGDAGYYLIADRIRALVQDGRLVAQRDISNWRHSEVRLP